MIDAKSAACPHCGKPKELYNATCTRSECQQVSFDENRRRNKPKKKGKK